MPDNGIIFGAGIVPDFYTSKMAQPLLGGRRSEPLNSFCMHQDHAPLVDREAQLERFPGLGGWTYVPTPEIRQNPQAPFGWVVVKGWIDNCELRRFKLMPMGEGRLFLPVRAAIRKKIKKEAGDWVKIVLYAEQSSTALPEELVACFQNDPQKTYQTFCGFSRSQQKAYLDWIYGARKVDTQIGRIATMMDRLSRGLKLHERDPNTIV